MRCPNTQSFGANLFMGIILLTAHTSFAEPFTAPEDVALSTADRFYNQIFTIMQRSEGIKENVGNDTFFWFSSSSFYYEKMKFIITEYRRISTLINGQWVYSYDPASVIDISDADRSVGKIDTYWAFQLHKNLLVSFNWFNTFEEKSWGSSGASTIMNIGPVWTSKFASVGLFYGLEMGNSKDIDGVSSSWRIVPKLNTKDYPLVGFIMEKIEGALGIKSSALDSYAINLFSRGFSLGNIDFTTVGFYHKDVPYNWIVNNKVYGLQVVMEKFIVEGGYQEFYESGSESFFAFNSRPSLNYKSSPFGKLTYTHSWFSIGAETSETFFPMPRMTYSIGIWEKSTDSGIGLFGHFYYSSENWEFSIGLRLKLVPFNLL